MASNYTDNIVNTSSYLEFSIWADVHGVDVVIDVVPLNEAGMDPYLFAQSPGSNQDDKQHTLNIRLEEAMYVEKFYLWFDCYDVSASKVQIIVRTKLGPDWPPI